MYNVNFLASKSLKAYVHFSVFLTEKHRIYGVGNDTTSGGEIIWYLALLGPCISSYASSVFPSTAFSNQVQSFKS